jgi:hypothetical protein
MVATATRRPDRHVVVHGEFAQLNVKAWLMSGIQIGLIVDCFARFEKQAARVSGIFASGLAFFAGKARRAGNHIAIALIHGVSG